MSVDKFFLIKTLWELFVAMETGVLDRPGPKPNKAFPHQNDATDKILLQLLVAEIYMFESVNRRTDALTDGRRLESHPIN